jgi:hypothetical protein
VATEVASGRDRGTHATHATYEYAVSGSVTFDAPEKTANWRPRLHRLLVIPHLVVVCVSEIIGLVSGFVVLFLLGIAAGVSLLIASFAVLFTGRWPDGLRAFVLSVLRWKLRVQAYFLLLVDEYPPFALD